MKSRECSVRLILFGLAAIMLCPPRPATAGALSLVKGKWLGAFGQPSSGYVIFAETNAPATVRLAADEVQRAVAVSTGVKLPIVHAPPAAPMVCMGDNAAARAAGLSTAGLPDDGFRIVTRGGNLYILGKDTPDGFPQKGWESRGTLFGAYEFLERVVGVRWVMPGELGEEIPARARLTVPDLSVEQAPAFPIREIHDIQNQIRSPDPRDTRGDLLVDRWLLRQKCANVSDAFKSSRQKILHHHAWDMYIKPEDMAAHPEFTAVDGSKGKFCTTNPQLVALFAQRVIEWLDQHPQFRSAPISPEDGGEFCRCPRCQALCRTKDWHGQSSITPLILKFYNDVARLVAQKHPDRILAGYVYYNYMYPPDQPMKMEPNVFLVLAPLNYYGWGLAKPAYAAELPKLIAAWTAVTPNFGYFNWSVWFRSLNGTPLPPALPILKLELPTLHRCGVKMAGMVGTGAWGYGGPSNYILAKLLWNAEADVDGLYREWLQVAYGPAAPTMERFYGMILERILERKRLEPLPYSGDNYEVNYDFVEKVYKPIFPELERLYLEALSKAATAKQRGRLEMMGDNLVMLHFNMRKAKMLQAPEQSHFYRTDAQYAEFLTKTEYWLSLYRDHGHRDTPLLFHGSFSGRAENPPMEVRKVTVARLAEGTAVPRIDGDLSDPAWSRADAATEFRVVGGRTPAKQPTTVRFLYDASALYLAFDCGKQGPEPVVRETTQRDDPNLFRDDEVELFLAVFPDAEQKFWQLALNAANAQWDSIGTDAGQNLAWTSATRVTEKGWTAEVAIPFRGLGLEAAPAGQTWRANLGRGDRSGQESSAWNAVYRAFREPFSFGEWTFAP